ncbi:MAG TPA: shikimate dehydrogenase [Thermomicrobiaceae bacterium]|nr:shikimate dehydrogenase [Thermomicrobiaceae bacterium]
MTVRTLRVGLIGYPVEHSLSPVMQQAAFDALGIPARYELWPTLPAELAERVAGLRRPDALGANVTVPHKTQVLALVDEVSPLARRAGAVNTIVNRAGRLYGDNTDVPGFLAPLKARGHDFAQTDAVILGAGGAARAVAVALAGAGCRGVLVANRTPERGAALARELGAPLTAAALDARLAGPLARAALLVNATAIGWNGEALPLDPALLDSLPPGSLVYDLTYRRTPLLRAAEARGLATLDGFAMLVQQGVAAFRLWTGQEPPAELMRAAAQAARAQHS